MIPFVALLLVLQDCLYFDIAALLLAQAIE